MIRSSTMRAQAGYAVLGVLVLAGCSAQTEASGASAPKRVGAFAHAEWDARLLYIERRIPAAQPIRPLALRAGGGLVSVLLEQPSVAFLVELSGEGTPPMMGGPNGDFRLDGTLARGYPSDVVTVTPESRAWYLDVRSGRLVSEDVGVYTQLVATLDRHGHARSGCALDSGTIAYVTDARPGEVFVRRLSDPDHERTLPLPEGYAPTSAVPWTSVRFGGSPSGPCVLWAPRMASVLLVSDSMVRPLRAFIEPVPQRAWYQALWRRVRRVPEPDYVVDATSFPGGVAVLFAGQTGGAGRMVDLYSERGEYRETMVLPGRALKVAGYGARVYVLRQRRDSVRLASYVLPASVRAAMSRTDGTPPQGVDPAQALQGVVVAPSRTGQTRLDSGASRSEGTP